MPAMLYDVSLQPILFLAMTLAPFVQPAVGATVDVPVTSASFYTNGGYVSIAGGGFYEVVSVDYALGILTLRNPTPAVSGNAAPAALIPTGANVSNAGARGAAAAGTGRVLSRQVTLLAGVVGAPFTGVVDAVNARAWACHTNLSNASTAKGFLQVEALNLGLGNVNVVVTSTQDAAPFATEAGDEFTVNVFLLDPG